MNKGMSKKDMKIEQIGAKLFFIYRLFKFLVVAFNAYFIYCSINQEPKLLLLCLILNVIYSIIYVNRIWAKVIGGLAAFYFTNDIYLSVCLGLAIGNIVSYILDFILIKFISFLSRKYG